MNGRLAALIQFLAKIGDKAAPFFQVLRVNKKLEWTTEWEEAFQNLKQHLRTLARLAKLEKGYTLFLYLSINHLVVSSVLVKNVDNIQELVYYVSKFIFKAEISYMEVKKHLFTLVVSARKLRLYFQEHEIIVLTNQSLKCFLQKPDTSGRRIKWVIALSEFPIQFAPRKIIKGLGTSGFHS